LVGAQFYTISTILLTGVSIELLSDLNEKGIVASYKITGYGYFITLKHKDLPVKRIVCDIP